MDELYLAVVLAIDCFNNHWRRGFIERAHAQIAAEVDAHVPRVRRPARTGYRGRSAHRADRQFINI